jgi:hypothetical protein
MSQMSEVSPNQGNPVKIVKLYIALKKLDCFNILVVDYAPRSDFGCFSPPSEWAVYEPKSRKKFFPIVPVSSNYSKTNT